MATATASLMTSAPPETLWALWSDPPSWPAWNPQAVSATLDGPFAAGTTATLVTKQGRHPITIIEVVPGKRFTLETKMPAMVLRFTCAIDAVDNGTRISQSAEVTGPASVLFGKPVAEQIGQHLPEILAALKETAEKRTAVG
ncbi:MAG TPA: SRPBCC family protein [Candidatus Acidoferrales bacterium]|nr:SRPBCC family protein [Candidatus Acidoferrales bacterium]